MRITRSEGLQQDRWPWAEERARPEIARALRRLQTETERDGDCLIWKAALETHGYGALRLTVNVGTDACGRIRDIVFQAAHRVSLFLATGHLPGQMHTLHRCDRRACVAPWHLYLGTEQDNRDDATWRGRMFDAAARRTAPCGPMPNETVTEVRRRLAAGETADQIAGTLPRVDRGVVERIANGTAYARKALPTISRSVAAQVTQKVSAAVIVLMPADAEEHAAALADLSRQPSESTTHNGSPALRWEANGRTIILVTPEAA